MGSAVTLRSATEADLDRLVEIHTACYPDDRGADARRRNFSHNPLGPFEALRVAERDGRVVGHGFGFSLAAYFGGAAVPIVGIASVGVAPEARGAGVGAAIVAGLEAEGSARGACLAVLHAFRHGFYARLGYGEVAPNRRLACDPRAIPAGWVRAARASGIRSVTGADVDDIAALHRRAAARATGWLERPERVWARRLASERLHFFVLPGAGYVSFEHVQREPHAPTRLVVHDLVADADEARRALFGLLGMQAGQVEEIEFEIADDDPIAFALTDVDGARTGDERVEHDLGRVVAGPMIRVLDVRRALEARGYARDGEAHLSVDGAPLRLVASAGRGEVSASASRDAASLDAPALASVAFGGLSASGAARLDRARGSASSIARADEVLRLPPFFTVDRF